MGKEKQKAKNIAVGTRGDTDSPYQLSLTSPISYGSFSVGANINQYCGLLAPDPFGKALDCDSYMVRNIDYYVILWCSEANRVETIVLQDHCYYQGIDLIGASIFLFMSLISIEPEKVEIEWTPGINSEKKNGENQHVYYFPMKGGESLMVWTWRKKIRTIMLCSDKRSNRED